MSLQTDIIFVKALRADASLLALLPAGDVYNTTIAMPDEELDNAPLPYVIVSFDGLQNDQDSKDDPYESISDTVNISVWIASRTRQELGELADKVRKQIHQYFMDVDEDDEDIDMIPVNYQFTAGPVTYNQDVPCYYQVLSYQCDTNA